MSGCLEPFGLPRRAISKNWWVSHAFRAPDFGVEWVSRAIWLSKKGHEQKLVGVSRCSGPQKIDGCLTLFGARLLGVCGCLEPFGLPRRAIAKIGGCLTLFGPGFWG